MSKAVLSEKAGSVVLTLFGVPFALVGLFVFYFMVWEPLSIQDESKNWLEVKAKVSDFEVDKKSGFVMGKYPEFIYTVEGKEYKTSRLYLDSNIPPFEDHKAIFLTLKEAQVKDAAVVIYVNPNDHSQAVLFNEISEDLLMPAVFSSIFFLAGCGIMTGGFFMFRKSGKKASAKLQNPDKEWMWDSKWNSGYVIPDRKSNLIVGMIFLIFWFGMSGIPAVVLYEEFLEGGSVMYISLSMGALGLLFVYFYIKSVFKYRKFGQSKLKLITFPGIIGKSFKGEIEAPFFMRPEGDYYFRLDCKRHYSTGTGDSRKSHTDLLHEDSWSIDPDDARARNEAVIIPVEFDIPKDLPASNEDGIFWTLKVYAETVGLDWSETYTIPVFKKK